MNTKIRNISLLFLAVVALGFVRQPYILAIGLLMLIGVAASVGVSWRHLFSLFWKIRFLFLVLLLGSLWQRTGESILWLPFFVAKEAVLQSLRSCILIAVWLVFSQILFFVANPGETLFRLAQKNWHIWWKKPLLHTLFVMALFPRCAGFIRRIVQEQRRLGAFCRTRYWIRDGVNVFAHTLEVLIFHLFELSLYLEQKQFVGRHS